MGLRGIKSRVFIQFWILFLLSMLFIDFLMVFFFLERSIAYHTEQKRSFLALACDNHRRHLASLVPTGIVDHELKFSDKVRFFYLEDNGGGKKRLPPTPAMDRLETAVRQSLESEKALTLKVGQRIGMFLLQHQAVIVTHLVKEKGNIVAAGGIESPLADIYHDFRRIQIIVFVFVAINSLFFALVGNRQLSTIYFRPLKRLARRAETYQDEDQLFFSVRKEDNEFSVLSTSLNKMLNRISQDKRVLTETIDSLTAANHQLKQAQNDVIRAEKLATVGRLTSGIAHEIGNPIGIVLGYLDLLKQSDLTADERDDFISRSESEITRISHIIRQLLDMSRSAPGETKSISMHQLLQDLVLVFNYQPSAADIKFETRLEAADDFVFADPDRLRQVFLNIILNSVDALNSHNSNDARITLTTNLSRHRDGTDLSTDGKWISVTILDNGPGIESADLVHVFDPFFTTKAPGKGTGLGLSVSFMIVEKIGGHIVVARGEKCGAVFNVILPLAD